MKFTEMVFVLILPLLFLSLDTAEANEKGSSVSMPTPIYCQHRRQIPKTPGVKQASELGCAGVALYNAGRYADALAAFKAADRIRFFEIQNYGFKSEVAIAQYAVGNIDAALDALDGAYVSILIDLGLVKCDPTNDFKIIPNTLTEGLSPKALAEDAAHMCEPLFHPYYEEDSRQTWETIAGNVEYYEMARSMTGLGRALPKPE